MQNNKAIDENVHYSEMARIDHFVKLHYVSVLYLQRTAKVSKICAFNKYNQLIKVTVMQQIQVYNIANQKIKP